MQQSQLLFSLAENSLPPLVGRTYTIGTTLRPTNVSIMIVAVEAIFASLLLDDHPIVEQEAKQLFEFRLPIGLSHNFGISRFKDCYQFSGSERLLQSLSVLRVTQLLVGEVMRLPCTIRIGEI